MSFCVYIKADSVRHKQLLCTSCFAAACPLFPRALHVNYCSLISKMLVECVEIYSKDRRSIFKEHDLIEMFCCSHSCRFFFFPSSLSKIFIPFATVAKGATNTALWN